MSELRDEIIHAVMMCEEGALSYGEANDRILELVAERMTSEATVREVAGVHEGIAPNPLMDELLVRGILNTATYAAGIRTAPGDLDPTKGEGDGE